MAKSRKSKQTEPTSTELATIKMATTVAESEDQAISELMNLLNVPIEAGDQPIEVADEVVEAAEEVGAVDAVELLAGIEEPETLIAAAPDVGPTPEQLAAALSGAEAVETMIAAAEVHGADGTVTEGGTDVAPTPEQPPVATTSASKKPRPERKHYANKADRIADRLGDDLPSFTVLTLDDAASIEDEASIKALTDSTMNLIRGMSKKKQNRAGFLIEFLAGKKASLNAVMMRALLVLERDGKITTGKDGNYLADLLAASYSPAAARAMGGNTVAVLEDLKLIVESAKGVYVANPESLLLTKVYERLADPAPVAAAPVEPSADSAVEPATESADEDTTDPMVSEPSADSAVEPATESADEDTTDPMVYEPEPETTAPVAAAPVEEALL